MMSLFKQEECSIYFDASYTARKSVGSCVLSISSGNSTYTKKHVCTLEAKNNNEAEVIAGIIGMRLALFEGFKKVSLFGDSISALSFFDGCGKSSVYNAHCFDNENIWKSFDSFASYHIGREGNYKCHSLAENYGKETKIWGWDNSHFSCRTWERESF